MLRKVYILRLLNGSSNAYSLLASVEAGQRGSEEGSDEVRGVAVFLSFKQ